MENLICHLQGMNGDLLTGIMARVDGSDLASVACTCSELRDIARDQSLWETLCHSRWPSTALEETERLISGSVQGCFDKFYSDACPLLLYDEVANADSCKLPEGQKITSYTSPSDLLSLVDVCYKKKCVLSRILDGIPEAVDIFELGLVDSSWEMIADEQQKWFLNYPFKLELMDLKDDDNDEALASPLSSLNEAGKSREDHCKKLIENLRLSWILVDKKTGKSVNLSSWKPLSVQKVWPYHATYTMQFGCVIPVEESLLPQKLARCMVTTRFKMTEREECLQWREISMRIENIEGAHVNGWSSLMILNKALYSQRSTNQFKVEAGFRKFDKQKKEMSRRRESKEALADRLFTMEKGFPKVLGKMRELIQRRDFRETWVEPYGFCTFIQNTILQ
ncbi:unnamed protein product [Dovyalis caffra]|uniref:F-box domain-containing protein n=1 Tax=Dovyalis caffra TaxID=77055 RepID=A0AAV1SVM0_9ROSI|nr:unnamed protein product [Dovyalis caffra]